MADIVDNSTPDDRPVFEVRDLPDDQAPGHATDYSVVGPAPSDVRRHAPAPQASRQTPPASPPALGGSMAIIENDIPQSKPVFKQKRKKPHYDQITRRGIALVVLVPTAIFYAAALAALIFHWANRDDLTAMVAAVSPFQALAAAVVGFYFAKKDEDPR